MSKPCYLYLITSDAPAPQHLSTRGGKTIFKMGITDSPSSRLRQLRNGSPYRLMLTDCWIIPDRSTAVALEKKFHASNDRCRLNGEWFYDYINGACCEIGALICDMCVEERGMSFEATEKYLIECGEMSPRDTVLSMYGEDAFA